MRKMNPGRINYQRAPGGCGFWPVVLVLVLAAIALALVWRDGGAAADSFTYTISPAGAVTVSWQAAPFNPYQAESYILVGDFINLEVLDIAVMAPLEVTSATCIAGLACNVTWATKLPALPCHDYDGMIVLGERNFHFYNQRVGCEGYHQFVPVVGR